MKNIKLVNISKKYGKKRVLENISLEISAGDFCVIVGPSGSGKSTLLDIISGLEKQTSGNILFDDKDMTNVEASNRNISMIFQDYALYPNMSVFKNIEFGLKIKGYKKNIRKELVNKQIKMNELEEVKNKYPNELSGGQRQRVALARALVAKPDIFLMDEPLSSLDLNLKSILKKEIVNIHNKYKTTTLYVTHDQSEALSMANQIIVVNKGKIEQIGTPNEIYNNPKTLFVASFFSAEYKNIFQDQEQKNELCLENIDGTILIRPEDFIIIAESDYLREKNNLLKGVIDFVEDYGYIKVITCKIGNLKVHIKTSINEEMYKGSILYVKIRKYYFFV